MAKFCDNVRNWWNRQLRLHGAGRWLIRCLPFSQERYGRIDEHNNHTNIEGLVALFAFFVTQLLAGIYFVQGKNARDIPLPATLLYGFVGLATLVAMGMLVGSHKTTEGSIMYAHDRGTITVGKWLLGCSLVLLLAFGALGWTNSLPGQGTAELKIVHADNYEGTANNARPSGAPAITVEIPIRPDQFSKRIPEHFGIIMQLNDPNNTNDPLLSWEPVEAQLFRVTADRWKERVLSYPIVDPSKTPAEIEVNVPFPEMGYILEVYLEPKNFDAKAFNALEKDAKATKLKTLREPVLKEIQEHGTIQISLKP